MPCLNVGFTGVSFVGWIRKHVVLSRSKKAAPCKNHAVQSIFSIHNRSRRSIVQLSHLVGVLVRRPFCFFALWLGNTGDRSFCSTYVPAAKPQHATPGMCEVLSSTDPCHERWLNRIEEKTNNYRGVEKIQNKNLWGFFLLSLLVRRSRIRSSRKPIELYA